MSKKKKKKKLNEPISVNVYICRKLKHWSEKFRQKLKPSDRFANLNGLEILNCYVHVGFLSNLIEIISLVFPFITNRSPCSEIQKPYTVTEASKILIRLLLLSQSSSIDIFRLKFSFLWIRV